MSVKSAMTRTRSRPEGDGWLTVNMWSPDRSGGLPVILWIQGGAYAFGMSSLPEYDGGNLARWGVVMVKFNNRLGWKVSAT